MRDRYLAIQSEKEKKKNDFFLVRNFEFCGIRYCYTTLTIPTNYIEAINLEDSKYCVSAMQKEFDSLVKKKGTFE